MMSKHLKLQAQSQRKAKRRRSILLLLSTAWVMVVLGGLFLLGCSEKPYKATLNAKSVAEVDIQVKHGFSPQKIVVPANHPVKLHFTRNESSQKSCMDTLLIPSEDVNIDLPPKTTQIVLVKAHPAGDIVKFSCGMKMVKGEVSFE